MKKVAILTSTLSLGGGERVASNVSTHLSDEYKQYLMIADSDKLDYSYKGELIDLEQVPAKNPFRRIKNLLNKYFLIKKINTYKVKHHIDATISFWHYGNIYNIFSKSYGKTIITIHTLVSKNLLYQGFFANLFTRLFYKKADKIIAVSKYIKYDLIKNYNIPNNKIRVIYNPFDINMIKRISTEELNDKYINIFKDDVIISIARISREKGHEFLIKAFNKVKQNINNVNLVFLGSILDHTYYNELQELILELNLTNNIFFIGFDKNPYKYLSRSKILTLTSFYEGLPCVMVEALSCRIPIVSVDCKSGPREILSPNSDIHSQCKDIEYADYGILTPPLKKEDENDLEVDKLSKAYIELLTNKELYHKYVNKSIERAEDFDINNIMTQYEEIIDE